MKGFRRKLTFPVFCLVVGIVCLLVPLKVLACDVTLSPGGQNIDTALANSSYNVVCLNNGTYFNQPLIRIPAGKTLKSVSGNRSQVTIRGQYGKNVVQLTGNNASIQNVTLQGASHASDYGVIIYQGISGSRIGGLKISNTLIGIGINAGGTNPNSCPGSSYRPRNVTIWDTFISGTGNQSNGRADPSIWIKCADNVSIQYGEVRGVYGGVYPTGDAEVASYHSTRVSISNLHAVDVGASALYFVNCDDCSVRNATIHRAGEWGIDAVSGSDRFVAKNNTVKWSNWGGSVFDEAGSIGGRFENNHFVDNNRSGFNSYCNGINIIGNPNGVSMVNNSGSPPPLYCTPPNLQ